MNTLLGIVRKDLRLHSLMTGLWLIAWAGSLVIPLLAWSVSDESYEEWGRSIVYGGNTMLFAQELLIAALLCVRIIQEDPPTHASALWRTLPVSGGQLLAAKLLLLWCLLAALPTLVESLLFFWNDMAPSQMFDAGLEMLALRTALVLLACAIGATTRGIRGIVGMSLLVGLGIPLLRAVISSYFPGAGTDISVTLLASLNRLNMVGILALPAFVLLRQYLSRPPAKSFTLFYLGFLVLLSTPVWWRWDFCAKDNTAQAAESMQASVLASSKGNLRVTDRGKETLTFAQLEVGGLAQGTVAAPLFVKGMENLTRLDRSSPRLLGKLRESVPLSLCRQLGITGPIAPHRLSPAEFSAALGIIKIHGLSYEGGPRIGLYLGTAPRKDMPLSLLGELRRFGIRDETRLLPGATLDGADVRLTLGEHTIEDSYVRIAYTQSSHLSLFTAEGAAVGEIVPSARPCSLITFLNRDLSELVLVNRERNEAVLITNMGQDRYLSLKLIGLARGRLKIPRQIGNLSIDEAWLKNATLAFVDCSYAGTFNCPLLDR